MPTTANPLAFVIGSVVIILVPGPSVLFIVGRALAHGRRAALASVAGNCAGVSVPVGATNPKAAVLLAAVLPQFTDPAAGDPAVRMLVLGVGLALTGRRD